MPFEIIRNDITKLRVDAVVNAANTDLQQGGGVCGAIFSAAGAEKLRKACDKIGRCETGEAVITKGFGLPAKFIIHTAGPVWNGGNNGEHELLYSCYKNSLNLAKKNGCESIAFPLISSGIYGYPKDKALKSAVSAVSDFLLQNDMSVSLVIFDKLSFVISENLYSSVKSFIDDNYADAHLSKRISTEKSVILEQDESVVRADESLDMFLPPSVPGIEIIKEEKRKIPPPVTGIMPVMPTPMQSSYAAPQKRTLKDALSYLDESFSQHLLRLIDEKKRSDSEVYKRANIDRRLFSKIRSNKDYKPSKNTVLAFAVALELSLDDTRNLLMKAGFALSRSNKLDVIVEYFITEGNYNIFEINEALFAFDQSLLGA